MCARLGSQGIQAEDSVIRLDRLLLLLDTGSSTSVRTTAAKQLAQLAAKSVISDVAIVEEDVKQHRQHADFGDSSNWSELMAVVARVYTAISPQFLSHAHYPSFRFYLTCILNLIIPVQQHQLPCLIYSL